MTADIEQPVGEEPEFLSRAAGGCVLAIGCGIAGCVVYAVPETGYFVAGLLATATVRKARGWVSRRRESDETEPEEQEPVDVVAVLQELGAGRESVLLTAVKDAAQLPDTKAVRALLDEAGIRVRAGVRTPDGNGPGVHADDIPAPSPTPSDHSPTGCLCSSEAANANTNNGPHLVQDEHNPHRWHVVKETV